MMKAIEITEPGTIRTVEREKPTPGKGEVLLKVLTVGYCGTDLSTFRGANPLVSYPRVPGHEIAGEIAELGEGVDGWKVGEQVLVFPYTSCGDCASCRADRPNCCQHNQTLGVQREGALAEFAILPADKLMRGGGLSPRDLALVEPLTVGAHAAARGQVTDKDTVAVFGCGAIGLGAIAAAHRRGSRVIAIDVDDRKLAIGKACGADACVNSREQDLAAALGAEDDGRGPSVVIEAVGLQETFRAAVDLVAFAGRVVYVGYAKQPVEYETKFFVMKELDIRGSRNALPEDFEDVIRMLTDGSFSTDQLISRETSIDDAPAAMQAWSEQPGAITKIHIRVS